MKAERTQEIVDAFIELVAAKGLEHVNLDDVAAAANIQRAAIRHFVGNRDDLVAAAITEVAGRCLQDLGGSPSFPELATILFDPRRVAEHTTNDDAWVALLPEATYSAHLRGVVRTVYDELLAAIAGALRRSHPDAPRARIHDVAYAVACLAEHNFTFQKLGYPRARSKGNLTAALTLAEQLGG